MTSPLRLAVITKYLRATGGAERYGLEVARRMVERGHAVDLYVREYEPALAAGMGLSLIPDRWRFSSVGSSLAFAQDAAHRLAGRAYDVVHSHERGWAQDLLTLHTFSYRGGVAQYPGWRRLDQVWLSPRSWLYLWLERRQMAGRWLVAVSECIREDCRRHYRRQERVQVIPPGVDTGHFHPQTLAGLRHESRQRLGLAPEALAVLFVGSEFRRKGLDLLLAALGTGMHLLVVGRGERLSWFRRQVAAHGLGGRVQFLGLAADVRPYLAAADLVALPSRREAFGMSILEAMSCGLSVVVSREAGVASLIVSGENGLTVAGPAQLRQALAALRDPQLRARLGSQARRTAEGHGWGAVALAHEELYFRIRADKARAPTPQT
ncbi:MAG: glycosyltransferase family 4 protein [Thermodesulfobacteriota bacterium]